MNFHFEKSRPNYVSHRIPKTTQNSVQNQQHVAANCAKSRARWAKLTNAQVKAQRVYLARNRNARRSAAVYHRRYVAYLRLLKARSKQRSAAYKRYATYVRNANAWAKRYNAVARG